MKDRSRSAISHARRHVCVACLVLGAAGVFRPGASANGQGPASRVGEVIPRDVREMYDRGLQFLATTQGEDGAWTGAGNQGPGVVGLALMVFLASGEDPNFGLYSSHIRRAVRRVISSQNATTGYLGVGTSQASMYEHGFAMLGLAEAYGTVDDRSLWGDQKGQRSIGQALELAVRLSITSQKKNKSGGWRYGPDATDADTSVTGSVLVGLLAARNAGIEVPDDVIDKALAYYQTMTVSSGEVFYQGVSHLGSSVARSSIATLVYSISRRKDLPQYKSSLGYLRERIELSTGTRDVEYERYYQAQALFQGDVEAWEKWNKLIVRQLKQTQQADGSFRGSQGTTYSTAMSLLAVALNYRFLPIYER